MSLDNLTTVISNGITNSGEYLATAVVPVYMQPAKVRKFITNQRNKCVLYSLGVLDGRPSQSYLEMPRTESGILC